LTNRLLNELRRECASTVEVDGEQLVLGHVYIERRMQPLNLHVEECRRDRRRGAPALRAARVRQRDQGAGRRRIFPGDMLLKNFGVTRHDRVVFYDYDEIQPIGEMSFRRIPPAKSYEEEMSAEPYWRVGDGDVFPSSSNASW
jgi:isocitrate dehydrogenase kinase/phosphatase